ncbi:MAG: DNA-3-methyladenine glycosylase [Flavobacteriales bacterium]|nr:DNA-3-methyladenine glycosylase [Flavobacteriales bacterium]
MVKLPRDFYLQEDVVHVARSLIGKFLVTCFGNVQTSGMIIETEAYAGEIDKASHAFGNRRTKRTETMFGEGGTAYVYLCYGIHHLFNVVTNQKDIPHAVLIRALRPVDGKEVIRERRNGMKDEKKWCAGPGTLSQSLGIRTEHDGMNLSGTSIWLEDRGVQVSSGDILSGPRVGVDYAGDHALWPYRFLYQPQDK